VVVLLVTGPFRTAWEARAFEVAKQEDGRRIYARVATYLLFVSLFVGLGIALLAKDFLRIMTPPGYWSGAQIVPLIAMSYILGNVRMVITTGLGVKMATHYLALLAAVIAPVNLLLNYALIPRYLAWGAAWATVISYAVALLLTYCVGQRIHPVRYEYSRCAIALAAAVLIELASTLQNGGVVASIAINVFLLLTFLAIAVALLDRAERVQLRRMGLDIAFRLSGGRFAPEAQRYV